VGIRLVLLDRDGVINEEKEGYVRCPTDLIMIPGSTEAIRILNNANFLSVVVTNQGAVGRGIIDNAGLKKIHDKLNHELKKAGASIDKIIFCPDHPDQATQFRKPGPGMLLQAMDQYKMLPQETVMIGDSLRDLEAAHAAQCRKILVKTGFGFKTLDAGIPDSLKPFDVKENLLDAVNFLVK
jgi:D-glycero-D-manno-heptose 1,7-bisphosphate phosphatase|tara:strand:+ start:4786 stop:5331 length:546 start_codon:yes stop_codon:yes gene_type:complete